MLKYRIPAAAVIVIVFCACIWYDAQHAMSWCMSSFFAVGTVLVLREFYRMVEAKGVKPLVTFGLIMGVALVFAHDRWCWEKWHGEPRSLPDLMNTALAVCVLGSFALQAIRRGAEGAMINIGTTLLGLIYVWFLPAFLIKIRHLGLPDANGWVLDGAELVVVSIMVAKMSDVGGFFVGRSLGRHKLCPTISPKKTWEGLAGGIVASILLVQVIRLAAPDGATASLTLVQSCIFGLLMAVCSLLGDLVESCLKRDSQVKDSGTVVPGFGGMMDVVDSLMVSGPVAYFFLLLVGARPALEALPTP
ncbi:MAG: phosphatidate cytidylyltransferase [Planctomycetota bacterium]|jgi:phosphatidate cytidylyltransferase